MPITKMEDSMGTPIEFTTNDNSPSYLMGIRFWNGSHTKIVHGCLLTQEEVDCMIGKLKEARDHMVTPEQLRDWAIKQADGEQ